MAWGNLTTAEIASGKAVTIAKMTKIKDCLDYLYGQGALLRGTIPNGNFEIDADSDGIPDGWTLTLFAAGAGAFDETTPMEGLRSWKFTHPGGNGNGGGYLTSEYLECSEYETYGIYGLHYTSVTGINDKIQIQYYDAAKVANGAVVDLYNSSACDLVPTFLAFKVTPTAGSKFLKIILTGGHTDGIIGGISYFDDINLIKKTNDRMIRRCETTITKTSNTTLIDIPDLTMPVSAGQTYYFRAFLNLSSSFSGANGGWKFAVSGTCTVTALAGQIKLFDATTLRLASNISFDGALGVDGISNSAIAEIEGSVVINAGGTLKLKFAQNSSSSYSSSVLIGSTFAVDMENSA